MLPKLKLFILILLPSALVLICSIMIIHQKTVAGEEKRLGEFLKSEWVLIANDNAIALVKPQLKTTLIAPDGAIKSNTANEELTDESYINIEEIRQALAGNPHMSIRLNQDKSLYTAYYAERLPSGDVLRIAYPADLYTMYKSSIATHIIYSLALLCLLAFVVASYISYKAKFMLDDLARAVIDAENGSIDLPGFNNKALDTAIASISKQSREISAIKRERKEFAEHVNLILRKISEGIILLQGNDIVYKNKRAEEILQYTIPENTIDIDNREILELLSKHTVEKNSETTITIDGKIINMNMFQDDKKLIILRDISGETLYTHFKADLVGNISHELKTPLSLIIIASETILNNQDISREYLDKFLNTIYKNARHMDDLFADLIELAQLENSQKATAMPAVSMSEILEDLSISSPRVAINATDQGLCIHPVHLLSVIENLVSNAIKYTTGKILVDITKVDNLVTIAVADEGPIIPKAERERLFERFYTISKSRNREKSGTGLGLSIVKHISGLYNGNAKISENSLGGNTFTVSLIEKGEE